MARQCDLLGLARSSYYHQPRGASVENVYDLSGRRIRSLDANGAATQYVYDDVGRLTSTIFADGTHVDTLYDSLGQKIRESDQNGRATRYEYDLLGRLRFVYDVRNAPNETTYKTEYRYDAVGNMVLQIDAAGNETVFEYDVLNRQTASIREGDRRTESHYDTLGRLESAVNARGQVIHYDYDPINDRLLSKDPRPGQADVAYAYFNDGLMQSVADDRGTTSYEYNDPRGRLTKRIDPDGATIEYAYDLIGNISSVKTTTPGNSPHLVTYEYDAQNRLTVVHDGAKDTVYTYDPSSRLLEIEYPNGVIEAREYDNVGRLTGVVHTIGSTTLAAYGYDFDLAGNITEVWENTGRVTEFVYDELYRLISERATDSALGDLDVEYDYDDVGNCLQKVDHTASDATEYHYDSSNDLEYDITGATRIDYDYDADGNTISKTTKLNGTVIDEVLYRWSSGNRLLGLDTDADSVDDITFQYDESGIRVSQTNVATGEEIRYLIDRERPFAQVLDEYQPTGANTSTTIVSYTYGNGLISQTRIGGTNYYHSDAHSGVRLLTDATGAANHHYTFDAFGALLHSTGSTSNAYLYRGEQFDSNLDQYYNRARYYDPSSGRFTALDPRTPGVSDLANANLYLYASANPVSYSDPSGLEGLGSVSVSVSVSISLQGMSGRAITGAISGAALGAAEEAADSYLGGDPDWLANAAVAGFKGALFGAVLGASSPTIVSAWSKLPHIVKHVIRDAGKAFTVYATTSGVSASLEEGNWGQAGFRLFNGLSSLGLLSRIKACFVAGTKVLIAEPDSTTLSGLRECAIENIKVGDRTTGSNPERHLERSESREDEPNSETWRMITLDVRRSNNSVMSVNLLRPIEWIDRYGIKVGESTELDIPEIGLVGAASVLSIEGCPSIKPGPGNIVTATICHQLNVCNLTTFHIEGVKSPIVCTQNHLFWSITHGTFVTATVLKKGDLLRCHNGAAASIQDMDFQAPVDNLYNIEVFREHVYEVSSLGILVHNSYVSELQNAISRGMRTFRGDGNNLELLRKVAEVLQRAGRPMSEHAIGEAIHKAKDAMFMGGADDIVFDYSGGMWDSRNGDYIAKVWDW